MPAKTVKDLVALARANPGKLSFASTGAGSNFHLAGELLRQSAKIDLLVVQYKGTGASIPDLVAGQVHLAVDAIPSALPHVKEGRLRALAVTGPRRSALAPGT